MKEKFFQDPYQWYAKRSTDGDEVSVGHSEYVTTTEHGSSYYDATTIPADAKTRKWCSLIAGKRRLIIRPRQDRSMQSFAADHWGTIYDVTVLTLTAHAIFMELANPVHLQAVESN